jgi:hypothetical protein
VTKKELLFVVLDEAMKPLTPTAENLNATRATEKINTTPATENVDLEKHMIPPGSMELCLICSCLSTLIVLN